MTIVIWTTLMFKMTRCESGMKGTRCVGIVCLGYKEESVCIDRKKSVSSNILLENVLSCTYMYIAIRS